MASQHTIQKAFIDLQLPDARQADTATVRDWCTTLLLEELDLALSAICPEDQVLVLQRLQLDLTVTAWDGSLQADPQDELRQQIRRQLQQSIQAPVVRIPLNEYQADILLRYFQAGSLPEIYSAPAWQELKTAFQQRSVQNPLFQGKLLRVLVNESAFRRWFWLVDAPFRYTWLDKQAAALAGSWQNIIRRLHQLLAHQQAESPISIQQLLHTIIGLVAQGTNEPKHILRVVLVKWLSGENQDQRSAFLNALHQTNPDAIDRLLLDAFYSSENASLTNTALASDTNAVDETDLSSVTDLQPTVKSRSVQPETGKSSIVTDTLAVSAAGLVVLAYFLPAFLRAIGKVDVDDKLIDVRRLPMLLYFIATGETQADEWQLVLPKILCGLPVADSCATSIALSVQEREEVNKLLTDVIDHWGRLKTTTPDGLRATFLQRTGHLTEKDAMLMLTIPETTVDILLSFIPWSFRYVRFSWMKKLLIVAWGTT